jgi:uncharacterized protein YjiS (DUF1127 family)
MAHASDIRIGGASFLPRLGELRADLAQRIANYRAYRATLNELRGLNLRELDDLGLAHANLPDVARSAVYGA